MLVDHADTMIARVARVIDDHLLIVQNDFAVIRLVVTHDAFDEGAFAGAVATEQRVEGTWAQGHGDVVESDEGAEGLGHIHDFKTGRADVWIGGGAHEMARMKLAESLIAPKTPFCMVTILTAASWLPRSVAAQQSFS